MTIAHGPKHHLSQDKCSWYSSRNTSAHLQQVGTNLEYEKVLSYTYPT
jgi:hypothetical protein